MIPLLATGHGLNDLIAGYFLGQMLWMKLDTSEIALGLFVYNLLAFGGQYPAALWIEQKKSPGQFIRAAMVMNGIALLVFTQIHSLALVLAGIASAIYHVAGGAVCSRNNRAGSIGLFAAPGVAGLVAGGWLAHEQISIYFILAAAVLVFLVLLQFTSIPEREPIAATSDNKQKHGLDKHDILMIVLLVVISLRSVLWNVFQLMHENDYTWLPAIAASAFVGKIAGGWIADRIGWRLYVYISLFTATPLLSFFRKDLLPLCLGIGLLQSGIPATTALLIRAAGGKVERGIGLSFGLAIIGGAVFIYTPYRDWFMQLPVMLTIAVVCLLLFWLSGLRKVTQLSDNKSFRENSIAKH